MQQHSIMSLMRKIFVGIKELLWFILWNVKRKRELPGTFCSLKHACNTCLTCTTFSPPSLSPPNYRKAPSPPYIPYTPPPMIKATPVLPFRPTHPGVSLWRSFERLPVQCRLVESLRHVAAPVQNYFGFTTTNIIL